MSTSTRSKARRRGVTRRVRDAQGNLVIKKYRRRGRRFTIPGLKFRHIPQILVGSSFISYGWIAYLHKNGTLAESENAWANYFNYIFDSYDAYTALFLAGSFATFISGFLGYAIMTKGIRVKKYGAAFRQLFALIAAFIIISAIISPFLNEPGKVRQLADDEYISTTDNYDLSGLDSPFYSELLDGLLDLLGNIPDPSLSVANITAGDDFPLDSNEDVYLWRWAVSETYSAEDNDYIEGYPNVALDYETASLNQSAVPDTMRKFNVDEQFLTITTSFTGKMLTPWNSEAGALVGPESGFGYTSGVDGSTLNPVKIDTRRDRNEQPIQEFTLEESGGGGSFSFDSYWKAEDKESITQKSVPYNELTTFLEGAPANRFSDAVTADKISKIWGAQALAGGSSSAYVAADPYNAFSEEYNSISAGISSNTTVYQLAFQIFNKISTQLTQDFLDGKVDISSTDATSLAGTTDKAYFYYNALKNTELYGIKDMLGGLINMMRAFDIPTRLVMGFSGGIFSGDKIELTMGNIHAWIEALIPWVDDQNNVHFAWGIFNPIPDPYILAETGEFKYGRNALGGNTNMTLSLSGGVDTSIPGGGDINGENSFNFYNFGDNVQGNLSLSFDEVAATNQPLQIRLLNDSILDSNGAVDFTSLDVKNLGTLIGNVTTDSGGQANFIFDVSRSGVLMWHDTTDVNITEQTGLVIEGFRPFESIGQNNIYMVLAMYGLSYAIAPLAWGENSVIEIATPDLQTVSIPSGFDTIDGSVVIPGESFNITITYKDNSTSNPITGESNIELMVMDRDTFLTLQTSFLANALDPTISQTYGQGTFPATDLNGQANKSYSFSFSDKTNDFHALIAQLQGTSIFGVMFVYLSLDVTLEVATYDMGADNKITTSTGENFTLTMNATALNSPASALLGFNPRPAKDVNLNYYIMEYDNYVNNFLGQPYSSLASALGSCSETTGVNTCYYLNPSNPQAEFNITGGAKTGANGLATAIIGISNNAFSVNDYIIIIVNTDFQTFTNATRFLVLSPPGLSASLIDSGATMNIPAVLLIFFAFVTGERWRKRT